MAKILIKRIDNDYAFEAMDSNGHLMRMDAAEAIGGHDSGIRPMQTLLMGLGGCGGVDIISILRKQKQVVTEFNMIIDGEREPGKEPSLWSHIHLTFQFRGEIEEDKAYKACALSINKYCSVAATLRAAGCKIEWKVEIIND